MTSLMKRNYNKPLDKIVDEMFTPFFPSESFYGPDVKVRNLDEAIEVVVAAPGINKESVNVNVEDNRLTIESTQKTEFSYSEFTRTWTLPGNVDSAGISASCQDGILRVAIPKVQAEKISIPIE